MVMQTMSHTENKKRQKMNKAKYYSPRSGYNDITGMKIDKISKTNADKYIGKGLIEQQYNIYVTDYKNSGCKI